MNFIVVGTNHRLSPLEIRERVSFSRKKHREASRFLKGMPGVDSFLILSTCNRSEVYLWSHHAMDLQGIFCGLHEMSQEILMPFLYRYDGEEALRHLLRVMCGLDSQIVGETQIFGQVRQAIYFAEESRALDVREAYGIARGVVIAEKIRREMEEKYSSGTLADAAFELIRRNCPLFHKKKFLLIGTGKVMGLFIPLLAREGVRPVIVSNRNHENAEMWACKLGGRSAYLKDLPALIPDSEIIISATSCPKTVLHPEHFNGYSGSALVLDLAVPRDVDASIKEAPGVKVFDLDDLGSAVVKNIPGGWAKVVEQRVRKECEALWKEWSGSEQGKVLSR